MKKFFRNNGLSLTFSTLFLFAIVGQYFTGLKEYNKERQEEGQPSVNAMAYLSSGHFLQATFENWKANFYRWHYLLY